MTYLPIGRDRFPALRALHAAYKLAIGEPAPTDADLQRLEQAIEDRRILFYGCELDGTLIAVCSVCRTFTTFNYDTGGVLEDFYIVPEQRHRGIARALCAYAYSQSGVRTLSVGCADCDRALYQAIGFTIPLGHLLSYEA